MTNVRIATGTTVDLPLLATRTRPDITMREYTSEQIDEFIRDDVLSPDVERIATKFSRAMDALELNEDTDTMS